MIRRNQLTQNKWKVIALLITCIITAIVTGLIIAEEGMQRRLNRIRAAAVNAVQPTVAGSITDGDASANAPAADDSLTDHVTPGGATTGNTIPGETASDSRPAGNGLTVETATADGGFGPVMN